MAAPTRALFQRYTEFFSSHVDAVFALMEYFSQEFTTAERTTTDIFAMVWENFAKLDPQMRIPALYDATYRKIRILGPPPPPLRSMDRPPIEGEWSSLRPSDVYLGTSLLYAAQHVSPQLDWPVLHLLVRSPIDTTSWSKITQRTLEHTTRYLAGQQLSAHRSILVAALELTGPECPTRPLLATGAEPVSVIAHIASCTTCNGFVELLVPAKRLIAAATHTRLKPADRQRILAGSVTLADAPSPHRARWWTLQG